MTLKARIYVGVVIVSGLLEIVAGVRSWQSTDSTLFFSIFILGIIGSFFKVVIPGIQGSMSMNFIFIMLGVTRLHLGETLSIGIGAALVQTFWQRKNGINALHVAFNVALIGVVVGVSHSVFQSNLGHRLLPGPIARLMCISIIYFLLNTGAVAAVISMTGDQKFWTIWKGSYAWSFAYYLLGASAVGIFNFIDRTFGLEMALVILPIAFLAYRSYRMRVDALEKSRIHAEAQRHHAEELVTLHLRTIRALALAIEAKDTTTGEHLHRVQTYAMAIGQELALSEEELQALRAASILHDIGKIAVPEYIISKPGRLSKEEFDKMKIHPLVGGQIIESVRFPYPVAPIVSAHHEKWNGTGYPCGLVAKQIPIGARILSAVDCLDALASDRQYRRALSIDEAMDYVRSESGKAFDPEIVEVLNRRYRELEALARSTLKEDDLQLSLKAKIERGAAPDAGLEIGRENTNPGKGCLGVNILDSMAEAFAEAQRLDAFDRLLAHRRVVSELLKVLTTQLRQTIPFDSSAFFVRRGDCLIPQFVEGTDTQFLKSLSIQIGSGLSGWVAEHKIPLLNGNPATESGLRGALPSDFGLRSALAVPLETEKGVLGVLTLYSKQKDVFHGGHLRLCMGLRSRLAYALEADLVTTAERTVAGCYPGCDLPNMGSLLNHLDELLANRRRSESFRVFIIRLSANSNGAPQPLTGVRAFVDEFGAPHGFVSRVDVNDFVVVFRNCANDLAWLEVALSTTLMRSGVNAEISVGASEVPLDATDSGNLVAIAASRLHPCARAAYELPSGLTPPCVPLEQEQYQKS